MDSFNYKYNIGTNQLNHVSDNVPDGDYASPGYEDTDGQNINNYTYDGIGNLIADVSENITNISWNVYGKITAVNYSNTAVGTIKNVYYYYDASGNRMGKRAEKNYSGGTSNIFTWYVRDASENVMATYGSTTNNSSNPGNLSVKERHIYGSSRLGILTLSKDVRSSMPSYTQTTPYKSSFIRGYKYYELANHLGNVLATVSDKKFGHTTNGIIDYYDADIVSATDYMPFGSSLPNRSFGSSSYRYAFNGKEKDKDGTGTSVQYDYGFRIYDPHLGRMKSVDLLTANYPGLTPYQFASNTPIAAIDLDGLEATFNYASMSSALKNSNASDVRNETHKNITAMAKIVAKPADPETWTDFDVFKNFSKEKLFEVKRNFVADYKTVINKAAAEYNIPPVLLAGVAFNEFGGDPPSIDDAAYAVRIFSGGSDKTSFGDLSMQLRVAMEKQWDMTSQRHY